MSEQDDPTLTTRVSRHISTEDETPPVETKPAEAPEDSGGIVQQIWRRIKEERNRPTRGEVNTRGQNNMDRSKAFLVLGTAVVLCGFAFLALFSTSSAEKRAQDRRTKPSLGRPEGAAQQTGRPGSTIPLLSADQGAGDRPLHLDGAPPLAGRVGRRLLGEHQVHQGFGVFHWPSLRRRRLRDRETLPVLLGGIACTVD